MLLVFSFIPNSYTFSQTWIDLKDPISSILGRGVTKINDGLITFDPNEEISDPAIDTYKSADFINDYTNKYRKFLTFFSSKEKFQVTNLTIYKASIKSINISDIARMKSDVKYVYEGYSADSMILRISRRKEVNVDYSKAINTIFKQINKSLITGKAMDKIKDMLPILDSLRSEKEDSIVYELRIKSPDIFFKVRVIQFKDITKRNWDSYFKWFDNLKEKKNNLWIPAEFKILTMTALNMETINQYPEFWGPNDNTNVKVKFGIKKTNGELNLYAYNMENVVRNASWKPYLLEPSFIDDKGMKHWAIDRYYLYSFSHSGKRKLIYVNIVADQVDANTVRITNWTKDGSIYTPRTFMKYPELLFNYVTK